MAKQGFTKLTVTVPTQIAKFLKEQATMSDKSTSRFIGEILIHGLNDLMNKKANIKEDTE